MQNIDIRSVHQFRVAALNLGVAPSEEAPESRFEKAEHKKVVALLNKAKHLLHYLAGMLEPRDMAVPSTPVIG